MPNDTPLNKQQFTIQVRSRGQVTLPHKLRDSLSIEDGDTLTLQQVGDAIFLTTQQPRTYELADKIAGMLEEEGVTLADLLVDLAKIREEIYNERAKNHS